MTQSLSISAAHSIIPPYSIIGLSETSVNTVEEPSSLQGKGEETLSLADLPPDIPRSPLRALSQKFYEIGLTNEQGYGAVTTNEWPPLCQGQKKALLELWNTPVEICGAKVSKASTIKYFLKDLCSVLTACKLSQKIKASTAEHFTIVGGAARNYLYQDPSFLNSCLEAALPKNDSSNALKTDGLFDEFLEDEVLKQLSPKWMDLDLRCTLILKAPNKHVRINEKSCLDTLKTALENSFSSLIPAKKEIVAVYKKNQKAFLSCPFHIRINGEIKELEVCFVLKNIREFRSITDRPYIEMSDGPSVKSTPLPHGYKGRKVSFSESITRSYTKEIEVFDPVTTDDRCIVKYFSDVVGGGCFVGENHLVSIMPLTGDLRYSRLKSGLEKHCPNLAKAHWTVIQAFCMGMYPQINQKNTKTVHLKKFFSIITKIPSFKGKQVVEKSELDLIKELVDEGMSYEALIGLLEVCAFIGLHHSEGNSCTDSYFETWALRHFFSEGGASILIPFTLNKGMESLIDDLYLLKKLPKESQKKLQQLIHQLCPQLSPKAPEEAFNFFYLLENLASCKHLETLAPKGKEQLLLKIKELKNEENRLELIKRCQTADEEAWKTLAQEFPDDFPRVLMKNQEALAKETTAQRILDYEDSAHHHWLLMLPIWNHLAPPLLQEVFTQKFNYMGLKAFQQWICDGGGKLCLLALLKSPEVGAHFIESQPKLFTELALLKRLETGSPLHKSYTEARAFSLKQRGLPFPKTLREAWLIYHPEDEGLLLKESFIHKAKVLLKDKAPSPKEVTEVFNRLTQFMDLPPSLKNGLDLECDICQTLTKEALTKLILCCPLKLIQRHQSLFEKLIEGVLPPNQKAFNYCASPLEKELQEAWSTLLPHLSDSSRCRVQQLLNRSALLRFEWRELSREVIDDLYSLLGALSTDQVKEYLVKVKEALSAKSYTASEKRLLSLFALNLMIQYTSFDFGCWKLAWSHASEEKKTELLELGFDHWNPSVLSSEQNTFLSLLCIESKHLALLNKNPQLLRQLPSQLDLEGKIKVAKALPIQTSEVSRFFFQKIMHSLLYSKEGTQQALITFPLEKYWKAYAIPKLGDKQRKNLGLKWVNEYLSKADFNQELLEALSQKQDLAFWNTLGTVAVKSPKASLKEGYLSLVHKLYSEGKEVYGISEISVEEYVNWVGLLIISSAVPEEVVEDIFHSGPLGSSLKRRMPFKNFFNIFLGAASLKAEKILTHPFSCQNEQKAAVSLFKEILEENDETLFDQVKGNIIINVTPAQCEKCIRCLLLVEEESFFEVAIHLFIHLGFTKMSKVENEQKLSLMREILKVQIKIKKKHKDLYHIFDLLKNCDLDQKYLKTSDLVYLLRFFPSISTVKDEATNLPDILAFKELINELIKRLPTMSVEEILEPEVSEALNTSIEVLLSPAGFIFAIYLVRLWKLFYLEGVLRQDLSHSPIRKEIEESLLVEIIEKTLVQNNFNLLNEVIVLYDEYLEANFKGAKKIERIVSLKDPSKTHYHLFTLCLGKHSESAQDFYLSGKLSSDFFHHYSKALNFFTLRVENYSSEKQAADLTKVAYELIAGLAYTSQKDPQCLAVTSSHLKALIENQVKYNKDRKSFDSGLTYLKSLEELELLGKEELRYPKALLSVENPQDPPHSILDDEDILSFEEFQQACLALAKTYVEFQSQRLPNFIDKHLVPMVKKLKRQDKKLDLKNIIGCLNKPMTHSPTMDIRLSLQAIKSLKELKKEAFDKEDLEFIQKNIELLTQGFGTGQKMDPVLIEKILGPEDLYTKYK